MFGLMKGSRVETKSTHMYPLKLVLDSSIRKTSTDIGVLASRDEKSAAIMIWNYHDEDKKGTLDSISISLNGLPKKLLTITHYRIDDKNSNSYETWKKMGSPQNPSPSQIAQLEKSGQLQILGKPVKFDTTSGPLKFELGRQGVSLLKIN